VTTNDIPEKSELPELTEDEKKVMDSLPDDLVQGLFRGEWWYLDRWWSTKEAVKEIKRLRKGILSLMTLIDEGRGARSKTALRIIDELLFPEKE